MMDLLEAEVRKGPFDVYKILEACTLDIVCGKYFHVLIREYSQIKLKENFNFSK